MADVIEKTVADTGADQTAGTGAATDTGAALGASDATTAAEGAADDAGKQEADAGTGGTKTIGEGEDEAAAAGDDGAAAKAGDGEGEAGDWPKDWIDRLSGGDKKTRAMLERLGSPEKLVQKLINQQKKIDSGLVKAALPEDATDEQKAEWRAANGIPESPEGYTFEGLPNGEIPGEEDAPALDIWRKYAFEAGMTPEQANAGLAAYYEAQTAAAEAQREADNEFLQQNQAALQERYGSGLVAEMNRTRAVFGKLGIPAEQYKIMMAARTPDGRIIGNDAQILQAFVDLAAPHLSGDVLVPGSGMSSGQSVDSEIADIESKMGDREGEYWKGPKAEKLQARYRDLLTARDKAQGRAA